MLMLVVVLLPTAGMSARQSQKGTAAHERKLTKNERLAFIRRAQVWAPTNVAAMDLRAGPPGKDSFAPNQLVACDYVETKLPGSSRKFACRIGDGDILKVRYGADNGEVEGSVLASRLLWALGFGADRVYPVRVECRGCSPDPWTKPERAPGEQLFDPAAIERKPAGHEMKADGGSGWAWPELKNVDEKLGGATRAQVDALTLLAVLMQHTDSKPEQQRLLCLDGGLAEDGECEQPFLMVHDVGLTFGHGNFSNRTTTGSVNYSEWARTPVWRDREACIGHLSRSHSGTLGDPQISEAGRAFLANLLAQLTDSQLHDLFDVARVESRRVAAAEPVATVDEWVAAFKQKRAEILSSRCPS